MSPGALASPEPEAIKREKKHKKEKRDKSEKKKRAREEEEEAVADAERKHKKSKSVEPAQTDTYGEEMAVLEGEGEVKKRHKKSKKLVKVEETETSASGIKLENESPLEEEKSRKRKKKKRRDADGDAGVLEDAQPMESMEVEDDAATQKKSKKKKSKKHHEDDAQAPATPVVDKADVDAMDVDEDDQAHRQTSSEVYQPPDMPRDPQFPFYAQTVSLYEPIYPRGWAQPVTNCQYQHLQHLKNRYVPSLHGVLLDYANVTLGEHPGRAGAAAADEDATILKSTNEYAVGFGWITADVQLFVPSRGAWMEGSVNLQTEGHIGVVCFGKFNASIEARRLPPTWKWVSNEDPEAFGMEETASVVTADNDGVVRQIHSTGFWVDAAGKRVKGKLRFRIRNFDVGMSGETSYLSLEGTMLDKESEKRLVKEEAALALQRKGRKEGHKRRAPEFAMTRFEDETQQEEAAQAKE